LQRNAPSNRTLLFRFVDSRHSIFGTRWPLTPPFVQQGRS
jgi:hypothetical protein